MEDLLTWAVLIKYTLIGLGILGVIILLVGLSKGDRELVQRGTYLVAAAVIISVCTYFIVAKTEERAMEYIPTYFEEMNEEGQQQDVF